MSVATQTLDMKMQGRNKIQKLDFIKLKSFGSAKGTADRGHKKTHKMMGTLYALHQTRVRCLEYKRKLKKKFSLAMAY